MLPQYINLKPSPEGESFSFFLTATINDDEVLPWH